MVYPHGADCYNKPPPAADHEALHKKVSGTLHLVQKNVECAQAKVPDTFFVQSRPLIFLTRMRDTVWSNFMSARKDIAGRQTQRPVSRQRQTMCRKRQTILRLVRSAACRRRTPLVRSWI